MVFTIPNLLNAATYPQQSDPDQRDFDALVAAFGQTGVISGAAVTAQGTPDMTVAVAAGVVASSGVYATVAAGNVTITAAHATKPRYDLIVASSAGVKSAIAGTAISDDNTTGGEPAEAVFPAITAGSILLAAVYVPAAVTAITTAMIMDKRVLLGTLAPLLLSPNTMEQRNAATAQTFRIYNTYTDDSNYERMSMSWASDLFSVVSQAAGTGAARNIALRAPLVSAVADGTSNYLQFDPANARLRIFASGLHDGTITVTNVGEIGTFVFSGPVSVPQLAVTSGAVKAQGLASYGAATATSGLQAGAIVLRPDGGSPGYSSFVEDGVAFRGIIGYAASSGDLVYQQGGSGTWASGTNQFRITEAGAVDLLIGPLRQPDITAPSTNATYGQLYVESGALKFKSRNGTVTTLGAL